MNARQKRKRVHRAKTARTQNMRHFRRLQSIIARDMAGEG